jgi:phosphate transport system substrate-binding protein
VNRILSWVLPAALLALLVGCSGDNSNSNSTARDNTTVKPADRITGGGSTFVAPMMADKWAPAFNNAKGIQVDYNGTGSGQGVADLINRQLDFGCTDAPLNKEQSEKAQKVGDYVHVPVVIGPVAVMYNLPDVPKDKPLNFTGPVLADIYLGKITKWNDDRIKEINKDAKLPDATIAVVARSDPSGTSYIFTDYLAKVSPEWKKDVGEANTLPNWPKAVSNREKGSGGVAGLVQKTPHAIGYVEFRYTRGKADIKYGNMKNSAGKFVTPSLESTIAATEHLKDSEIPDDLKFSMTNMDGDESYPICGATWAVMFTKQKPEVAAALKEYFGWVLTTGQGMSKAEDYAPLPKALAERAQKKVDSIKGQ